jgi:hypothetical protein
MLIGRNFAFAIASAFIRHWKDNVFTERGANRDLGKRSPPDLILMVI